MLRLTLVVNQHGGPPSLAIEINRASDEIVRHSPYFFRRFWPLLLRHPEAEGMPFRVTVWKPSSSSMESVGSHSEQVTASK